jgi:hypothetical protein
MRDFIRFLLNLATIVFIFRMSMLLFGVGMVALTSGLKRATQEWCALLFHAVLTIAFTGVFVAVLTNMRAHDGLGWWCYPVGFAVFIFSLGGSYYDEAEKEMNPFGSLALLLSPLAFVLFCFAPSLLSNRATAYCLGWTHWFATGWTGWLIGIYVLAKMLMYAFGAGIMLLIGTVMAFVGLKQAVTRRPGAAAE